MKNRSLDLFSYHDYRLFLKDWFQSLKEHEDLSLRDVAEACGIATGYLPMVLSGKRNLTEKAISKLQKSFKFNREELTYFKALVRLSDEAMAPERMEAFEEIRKIRSFREKNVKELEVFNYLSNWLNVAIREMALRPDFDPSADWISDRLVQKVSHREIEASLAFLKEQGFLVKNKSGKLAPSEKQLDCFAGVFRLSLGEFHKQMFKLAADSIDLTPRDQRNLLGHTFLIPEERVDDLRAILDETLKKVEKLGAGFEDAGPVYHVILSTFPVAKKS